MISQPTSKVTKDTYSTWITRTGERVDFKTSDWLGWGGLRPDWPPARTFTIKIYTEMCLLASFPALPGFQFGSYCLQEIWDYARLLLSPRAGCYDAFRIVGGGGGARVID